MSSEREDAIHKSPTIFVTLLTTLSIQAHSSENLCKRALLGKTINESFESLSALPKEKSVRLTQFLNEAITPLLTDIHQAVRRTDSAEIFRLRQRVQNSPIHRPAMGPIAERALSRAIELGFDRPFDGLISQSLSNGRSMRYAYTEYNKEVMKELSMAIHLLIQITSKEVSLDQDPTLIQVPNLLARHTFSTGNIRTLMSFGLYSVLQAAAQLTAEPVGNLSASQLMHKVMNPNTGERLSPVALYSLRLPPSLLAESGISAYKRGALELNSEGRIELSSGFCSFLKIKKSEWAQSFDIDSNKAPRMNEFGHGCPVAHRSAQTDRPGLQLLLDSIEILRNHN